MMRLYAVQDVKAKVFSAPMMAPNDGTMRRGLMDMVNGRGDLWDKYPEDFNLYVLGEYDEYVGQIVPLSVPVLIDNVKVLLGRSDAQPA